MGGNNGGCDAFISSIVKGSIAPVSRAEGLTTCLLDMTRSSLPNLEPRIALSSCIQHSHLFHGEAKVSIAQFVHFRTHLLDTEKISC